MPGFTLLIIFSFLVGLMMKERICIYCNWDPRAKILYIKPFGGVVEG